MKIISAVGTLNELFSNNSFDLNSWNEYIEKVFPGHKNIFIQDMENVIKTGTYTFNNDFLPILNGVNFNKDKREEAIVSFNKVTNNLEEKIIQVFGKNLDVTIVLYVGLCNGAGWVIDLDSQPYVLLGLEKIIELDWCDVKSMYGLIYHELGHVFQMQYGVLEREFNTSKETFLWQLFTEGIAMFFEQKILNNFDFFHQDRNGWLLWCDENIKQIKMDFHADLEVMTKQNQRYFGDWVYYKGYNDVGYYIGARFVKWLSMKYDFDELISFQIDKVSEEWCLFCKD